MSTEPLPSTGKAPAVRLRDDEWGAGQGFGRKSEPTNERPGPPQPQLPPSPPFRFNDLHISYLPQKVDGITEHLFVAILNGEAVGSVIAKMQEWKACGVRVLYVAPKHRHTGIATRLMREVEAFAIREKATQLELCVIKANTPARQFWIHRCKFIDDIERQADGPRASEYVCMVKPL